MVYVNDILITGCYTVVVETLITKLQDCFALKDLGHLNYFLGLQVTKSKEGLHLSQTKHIKDLLVRAKMDGAKSSPTPMTTGLKLMSYAVISLTIRILYRSIIGILQYVTIARLEISYCVNKV